MTTLVATVFNDFIQRLPSAHASRGMNVKNRTRNRRLGVVWNEVDRDRDCWTKAHLWTWFGLLGVIVTVESNQLCMCEVWTRERPSTQIILFERIRQSAWLDAMTTQLTRHEWILAYQNTFFFGWTLATKKLPKNPRNAFSESPIMSRFRKFTAGAAKNI